jgi:hypothetical protein
VLLLTRCPSTFATLVAATSFIGSVPVRAAPLTEAQPQVRISAQVDRTTVEVGGQLTLTITIEGDVQKIGFEPFEFPKAFRVAAQSRATNLSMELGRITRSISLIYALVALEPGTFQLGPFELIHRGETLSTEPLEIVVTKPVLPPTLKPSDRFVL